MPLHYGVDLKVRLLPEDKKHLASIEHYLRDKGAGYLRITDIARAALKLAAKQISEQNH